MGEVTVLFVVQGVLAGLGALGYAAGLVVDYAIRLKHAALLRRSLVDARLVPIGSIRRAGQVALEGRVVPIQLMRSPVSGTEVVGYRLTLVDRRGEVVADLERVNDFELADPSGRALVRPRPCVCVFEPEPDPRTLFALELAQPPLDELLDLCALPANVIGRAPLRAVEHLLRPGDTALVIGRAELEVARDGEAFRDAFRVVLAAPPEEMVRLGNRSQNDLKRKREIWRRGSDGLIGRRVRL